MNRSMIGRLPVVILALFVFFISAATPSMAQTLYGSVVGTVEDSSGAAAASAKVSLLNPATGASYEGLTDASGQYTILNVLPGNYDLKATLAGFKTVSRSAITVSVNTISRVDFKLEVGNVSEQVTVQADAVLLQTDKGDTHTEISKALVKDLPLPGFRNYQSLINLVPGATPASFQNSVTDTPMRSLRTNINGTNANNNVTRIDGAASVNLWLPHHAGYVMPAEMVEAVNVTTTAGDAEQGMAGGAAITLVTKSGTNDFHGAAFWFHDNQTLRARNFFATRKPTRIYNNYGGTFSGPVIKNKLFFFYSFDQTKQRDGATGVYSVPQLDLRRGDFSRILTQATPTRIFDPLTSGDPALRQQFPNNIIPASRISPIAQRIQQQFPNPTSATLDQANLTVNGKPLFNRTYNDVKFNWNRNEKSQIWGRVGMMIALSGGRGVFGDGVGPAPGADPGLGDTKVQNHSIGHTYSFSPNVVLDGVFGFQRMDQVVSGQDFGRDFSSSLGIPGLGGPDPRQQGFPNISFNGYNGFGVPNWMPAERIEESFTSSHNLRWIKGKHSLAMGVDGILHRLNHWQPELGAGPRGAFNFNGGITGNGSFNNFNSYAAFLLGQPNTIQKSLQHILATGREWQFGAYISDRWQVSRKLTISMGLRYENYPLMGRAGGKGIERLDPETNQVFLGGRGNVPRNNGFTVSKMLFAPRLGIAYRLDDKTVIRTGYGINFSPLPWSRPLRGFYPLTVNFAFVAPNDNQAIRSLAEGIPPVVGPDLSSGVLTLPAVADMRTPPAGHINRGYIQSWNFTIERNLPGKIIGSVAYVGTQSVKMMGDVDINAGQVIGLGNPGRPYSSRFGRNIGTLLWNGGFSANYHSLQMQARRQVGGLTLQGAYTWSKAINLADDEGWQGVSYNWLPAFHRNRAPAGYDRSQVFQMGWFYDLPMGKGRKYLTSGPVSHIVGGWNIGGITAAFTGTPLSAVGPGGTLNLPGSLQTADQVGEVRTLGNIGTTGTYYDTSAFRGVPAGANRFGSMGRNALRNPGVFRNDLTIVKDFDYFEKLKVQFRTEMFNFTNSRLSTGFGSNDVTNANFLRVTGAADERLIRFALRFSF